MLTRPLRLIAVDVSRWDPSQETFNQLLDFVDEPSAVRIKRFRHRSDALRSLVGRLLPIYVLQHTIPVKTPVEFKLGSHGRPYIATPSTDSPFDYNISHDGPWVIGAFTFGGKVGVDVMSLDLPDGIESTFDLREALYDQLSPSERTTISLLANKSSEQPGKREEEERIYLVRLWMYKESLSKLIGLGASLPFSDLSFDLPPPFDLSSSNQSRSELAIKILSVHGSVSRIFPPLSEMMFREIQLPIVPPQQTPSGVVLTTALIPTLPTTNDNGGDNDDYHERLELIEVEHVISGVWKSQNGSSNRT
ncbi:Alpha-aminoadipic semialdehyde dehydrogenase-phosphopantetheinyl transferase [Phaffia rhodozyma]|uniref:holo-[acyl-carrier-protein] synthase n=1 Tax=Phaffia rhodozyma TaxID=264483 RepID=A0A0F7SWX5_PHARH|nr:Alpha-aminoadipic semialdehyde dehydrogenase-phosphopantetheinyl transferase [Phaffia rhodozyma]